MSFVPVTLTDKAIQEVHNIMDNKNIPEAYGLRVGIKGSGSCVGFSYMLGFDKKKEDDISFTVGDGIPVYIEKKHAMYLVGVEVDFYEGADARGFTFIKSDDKKN
ncbi:MAG: iron-sulfur cluster assembly accessory protein [Fulvivirga sp.]|nr:iron-sulfur cluster assembly accessory protein [Fulvivirga sp.]